MASARTTRHATEDVPVLEALSVKDETASPWRASGIGMQPAHANGASGRRHQLTAEELHQKYPATYQRALEVVEQARMNPGSTPADLLQDLVPILTDDTLKTASRRR
jgi:hypothetical protein